VVRINLQRQLVQRVRVPVPRVQVIQFARVVRLVLVFKVRCVRRVPMENMPQIQLAQIVLELAQHVLVTQIAGAVILDMVSKALNALLVLVGHG